MKEKQQALLNKHPAVKKNMFWLMKEKVMTF